MSLRSHGYSKYQSLCMVYIGCIQSVFVLFNRDYTGFIGPVYSVFVLVNRVYTECIKNLCRVYTGYIQSVYWVIRYIQGIYTIQSIFVLL